MDEHILIKDSKYEGKYVAFQSLTDHTIVANGDEPHQVMKAAKAAGAESPMLIFVPDNNISFCL